MTNSSAAAITTVATSALTTTALATAAFAAATAVAAAANTATALASAATAVAAEALSCGRRRHTERQSHTVVGAYVVVNFVICEHKFFYVRNELLYHYKAQVEHA